MTFQFVKLLLDQALQVHRTLEIEGAREKVEAVTNIPVLRNHGVQVLVDVEIVLGIETGFGIIAPGLVQSGGPVPGRTFESTQQSLEDIHRLRPAQVVPTQNVT